MVAFDGRKVPERLAREDSSRRSKASWQSGRSPERSSSLNERAEPEDGGSFRAAAPEPACATKPHGGGRGSGKSHFFAELAIEDSLAEPGESEGLRTVCIREVQKDLAQSSKALIEAKLSALRLTEADGFKVFKDVIQTPGDGLMIFKGHERLHSRLREVAGRVQAGCEEAQNGDAEKP